MSIAVNCHQCHAHFELKDELEGKKGRCPNCGNILVITAQKAPSENNTSGSPSDPLQTAQSSPSQWVFSHNLYGVKQKKITINEKYFIRDENNNDLLFSMRRTYIMRGLLSVFVFILILGVFTLWWLSFSSIDWYTMTGNLGPSLCMNFIGINYWNLCCSSSFS